MTTIKHYHHNYHFSYTTSFKRHFYATTLVLLLLIIIILLIFSFISPAKPLINAGELSIIDLAWASFSTLSRLIIAYFFSVLVAIPLALLITATAKWEKILLPFFDILQSVPVLAFFPVIVLAFIKINYFEGAAIFVLFMAMLWNLVFSMIGGLKLIPADIIGVATVFRARGFKKLWYITLPAVLPYIITGSLLAWAQGWNILIVAEVLHNYIPHGSPSQDLYGLGSLLVNASYQNNHAVFLASLVVMIIIIGILNFFIWQKLLHLAERYKFD